MLWEFKLVTHPSVQTREGGLPEVDLARVGELNRLGAEGWELVTALPVSNPDGFSAVTYVFKRPRESWSA